jgi:hypothetical protein
MPNLAEVHANVTNTHWYLGIYLLLVILADAPRTSLWKTHDWTALTVAGLTGPMVIFALPALGLRYFAQRRTPAARPMFLVGAVTLAFTQLVCLWFTGAANFGWPAGSGDILSLVGALGSRIFLGFLTPTRWVAALSMPAIAIPTVLIGLGVAVAVAIRRDWRARALVLITVLVLLAALYTPAFVLLRSQWSPLLTPDEPGYFVVTSLAWAATLIFFAARYLPRLSNVSLAAVAFLGGFLILFDFTLGAVTGADFGPQADRILAAPPGETVTVPIAPRGWEMTLQRH